MTQEVDDSWPYYTLDLPGLSRADAERILEWVGQQGPTLDSLANGEGATPGWIVEPDFFYARYVDKCTVATLKKASEIALTTGQLTEHEATVLSSTVEDFAEWLEQAAETDDCSEG